MTALVLALVLLGMASSAEASPGLDWLKRRAVEHRGVGGCAIQRDNDGAIYRNKAMIRRFHRLTGFPRGRKGWVVDHVRSLKRNGCDVPENMQWQTIADAKEKDRWE